VTADPSSTPSAHPAIQRAIPWIQRVLLLIGQLALALPFLVVRDCTTGAETARTGLQVYTHDETLIWFGLVQLIVAIVLGVWAWRPSADPAQMAAGLGIRATLATLGATIALLGPPLAFILDKVLPRVGWVLHAGSFLVLALACVAGTGWAGWRLRGRSVARPEQIAAGLVLFAPLIGLGILIAKGGDGLGLAAALAVMAGLPLACAALGVGAMVAAANAKRRRWRVILWTLVVVWCALWGSALA